MSLKHGLLGILDCGEMTGYELDRVFRDSLAFFWHAQTSQIYRELTAMESLGWLSSTVVPQSDRPNKKVYALTPSGKEELIRWLREDNLAEEINTKNPFLMRLFFLGLLPPEVGIEAMERYRDACSEALSSLSADVSIEEYRRYASSPASATYWGITADFGRRFYEMGVEWANDSIDKIREATK